MTNTLSSLLLQTKQYLSDTLVQLITDPPHQQYNPSAVPSSPKHLLQNLLRSLLLPWTKKTDNQHPHGRLTKWAAGIIYGMAGLSAFVALREALILKRSEKSIRGSIVRHDVDHLFV